MKLRQNLAAVTGEEKKLLNYKKDIKEPSEPRGGDG